jgi:hypothetical protein
LAFANIADTGKRCLLLVRCAAANTLNQGAQKVRPFISRKLDCGNGGDDLGSSLASLSVAR